MLDSLVASDCTKSWDFNKFEYSKYVLDQFGGDFKWSFVYLMLHEMGQKGKSIPHHVTKRWFKFA